MAAMINDAVFPGLQQAIVNLLEKNCITNWMTNVLDKIGLNAILGKITYQISKPLSVELVYFD